MTSQSPLCAGDGEAQKHNIGTPSAAWALLRWPQHGFLGSTTERHAGGRNMEPMGHQRSCCACC